MACGSFTPLVFQLKMANNFMYLGVHFGDKKSFELKPSTQRSILNGIHPEQDGLRGQGGQGRELARQQAQVGQVPLLDDVALVREQGSVRLIES